MRDDEIEIESWLSMMGEVGFSEELMYTPSEKPKTLIELTALVKGKHIYKLARNGVESSTKRSGFRIRRRGKSRRSV